MADDYFYLNEFAEGLKINGVSETVKANAEICKQLFVIGREDQKFDANYVFSLMSPEYSNHGTSKRVFEESRVLGWLTGQRHISLNGDTIKISVQFDHDCLARNPHHTICFLTVGACGRVVTLPVAHRRESKQFRYIFLFAFCNGGTFATP